MSHRLTLVQRILVSVGFGRKARKRAKPAARRNTRLACERMEVRSMLNGDPCGMCEFNGDSMQKSFFE